MPTQWAARRQISGSCSRNHNSLTNGDIGCTGVPVRQCSASQSPDSRSRRACGSARSSAQMTDGVNGLPSGPSAIRLCMADEKAIPATGWPAAVTSAMTSRTTATTAVVTASGS